MNRITTVIAAGLLALATALPASAQTDAPEPTDAAAREDTHRDRVAALDHLKRRAQAAVDRRLETLDRMTDLVSDHGHMTTGHKDELLADYAAAEAGLVDLNSQIQAAATVGEALALLPKIAEDYRVYLVMVPKSHGVAVSDAIVAAGDRIVAAGTVIQAAIDRAEDAGVDATTAQQLLEAALADGAAGVAKGDPVAESVIDLDAANWPDPAESVLRSARADLQDARASIRSAVEGLRGSVAALREALGNRNG
ncbi:MAG: hypothetical protein OEM97_10755 [Acidimicrobiia bacterium]|nr:hypothetical protein [Acidimicrobiia bacterium]